ncbi:acetate/propionate family kinase [Jiangella alkaliphila]|uniref:Acetate kinase n=1 Tax=Jiangella alkaliphila TaxID=419479 RepID=A0A1H2M3S0_9ACTN|nr:acetate kinase [Jiangella alkaliphila]SDU87903.1 acetate kinase [Jiangella alkaliphila]
MTVLVLNCGSSSIKYQLIDPAGPARLAKGIVERIGEDDGVADHAAALRQVIAELEAECGPLDQLGLAAVGHRIVHGGDRFAEPTVVDDDVERAIEELAPLAPLHNPPGLTALRLARRELPDVPHVAVFDTAFHQTLPPVAYTYALDRDLAGRYGVRRYGFHGTSVSYVSREAARLLDRDPADTNLVVLHLGNGASATAVRGGRSVDTSMGLTPLEGLVMGTRTGDLDPGALFYLHREAGLSVDELDRLVNRSSGLLGLAGANDLREVHRLAKAGDAAAQLARELYCYRIRHYVGAYLAVLAPTHAIVFTAGVGENDSWVRSHSLAGLRHLGVEVDHVRNSFAASRAQVISPDEADVTVLVVPTDEELEIARQAAGLVGQREP